MPHKKIRPPKDLLAEHGLKAKKSFGQNFLVDEHHLEAIARQVQALGSKSEVFEIGSGLGALTRALLNLEMIVHAVERDRDMARIFREEFAEDLSTKNLSLHEDNATTFDYSKVAQEEGFSKFILCGNLPYHLTSTLIFKALEMNDSLLGSVFMIQKEVAERIVAEPGSRDYGILSVLVQAKCYVSITHHVPSGAFWPRPKVDSSVITMVPIVPSKLTQEDFNQLKKVVKAAFSKRRKTLRNCLKEVMAVDEICQKAGISADLRPEALTPDEFLRLVRVAGREGSDA